MKSFDLLIFLCIIILITGCSNGSNRTSNESFSEGFVLVNDGIYVDGLIMVNDGIYVYTGYEVSVEIDKVVILGKITSTVDYFEIPTENGQANFNIKGAKYAQYENDIVVLIDNEWILFKNRENMISGFSVSGFGFLMSNLSDEEIYKVFRTIRKYIIVDEDYEANLDSIIEKSFKERGIDDSSIIDTAISNLQITVSDTKK